MSLNCLEVGFVPFASPEQRRAVMARLHPRSAARPKRALSGPDLVVAPGDFRSKLQRLRGVKTFFTDPPYNLGFKYGPVNDRLPEAQYDQLMGDLARLTYEAAAPDASLFVVHYPETLARLWPVLTKQWKFRQWLTWCYPSIMSNQPKKWDRTSRTILWLTKGDPSFDKFAVTRPYEERPKGSPAVRNAKLARGAPLRDWWTVRQIMPTDSEYCGYSNQIPSEIIRRCVLSTTKPGELVADPFAGTASTVKTAASLGRRGWACDANPEAAKHWGYLQGGIQFLPMKGGERA